VLHLLDVMIPIALVAGTGFLVGRSIRSDATAWAKLLFYVLGPALVFQAIYRSEVEWGRVATVAVITVGMHGAMLILSRILGRIRGWDEDTQATGSLVLTFPNCGNYGLPVLLFAWGEPGFALGVVFVLVSLLLQGTLGIAVAAWRRGDRWYGSLGRAARAPYLYAFLVAWALRQASVALPVGIERAVGLLADAAIPCQLLMLGFQLSRVRVRQFREVGQTAVELSLIKLLVPPLLVWAITTVLGIGGLLRAVLVIQAAMPSAVNAIVLTANYNRQNALAASTVLVSTGLSLFTITLLLGWLR
jgi:malate permease and related proteins